MNKVDEAALSSVIERLERHRQAATYGAVAGVIGGHARSLMSNKPRDPRHSWVVSKMDRKPSGYSGHEMHPDLLWSIEEKGVIATPEALKSWLDDHP